MKEKCDNNCATCPLQSQIYCCLIISKASNESNKLISERLDTLEKINIELASTLSKEPQEVSLLTPNDVEQ